MRAWWCGMGLALALAVTLAACGGDGEGPHTAQSPTATPNPDLAAATFQTASGSTATMALEVADTEELRTCGLMHRLSMPENQGMLFTFDADVAGPFWNRNTFIPLTLAWIAADGTILDLTDMANVRPEDDPQVNTLTPPRAGTVYRYVIEANQGWFARNGVAIGDHVDLAEPLARGSQGAVPICREKGL